MGSGGARTRSGPAPDPMALRRDRRDDAEWTTLPAEGRAGDPPAWPLTRATIREAHMWAKLWAKPQAVQWAKLGQEMEVALYTRRFVEAEKPKAAASLTTLVRQMADALGLTIPGMRVNRWRIATDQVAEKRQQKAGSEVPGAPSARDRFQVVRGKAG